MTTVAFVEIDPFCQKVLRKHWRDVPIYGDIKTITGEQIERECGTVDLVCGGFPCQPFSIAGKRKGREDDRALWPEMSRIISEVRPRWVIGENVGGFINMEFDNCAADLESQGYEVQAFVIPACAINAPHRRDRVWIVAYNGSQREKCSSPDDQDKSNGAKLGTKPCGSSQDVAHTERNGSRSRRTEREGQQRGAAPIGTGDVTCPFLKQWNRWPDGVGWWQREPAETLRAIRGGGREETWMRFPESLLGRVVDGLPNRVDRLKSLGNAVVPQIPEIIGRAIMEIER